MGVFSVGVCFGTSTGDDDPRNGTTCHQQNNYDQGNTVVGVPAPPTEVEFQLQKSLPLTSEPINLFASLRVDAYDGSKGGSTALHFANTAQLAITLPEGYSFTSQLGYLLAPRFRSLLPRGELAAEDLAKAVERAGGTRAPDRVGCHLARRITRCAGGRS